MADLVNAYAGTIQKLVKEAASSYGKSFEVIHDGPRRVEISVRVMGKSIYCGTISLIGAHLGQELFGFQEFIRYMPAPAV
jgi:hypothetical protein